MEALTSEVKRMFRAELEQFHEKVEQSFEHPRNPPTVRRRERLPRRGAWVDEEEYDGGDFEDENVYDSGVSNKRYGGRHREDRNREDNNLGFMAKVILARIVYVIFLQQNLRGVDGCRGFPLSLPRWGSWRKHLFFVFFL